MLKNKKILIVEDDPKSLYAFHAVLQAHDFEAVACESAEHALQHINTRFDVAIVDVRLPKMQGTDFALHLRLSRPSTRIILVTAYDGIHALKETIPGCDVLLKPIDMDILLQLL